MFAHLALPTFDEERPRCELKTAIVLALVSALGLAIVGAIPLQSNCVDVLEGRAQLTLDSGVHQGAASVFFLSSWAHGAVSLRAYGHSHHPRLKLPPIQRACFLRKVTLIIPISALVVLVFVSIALQGHPGGLLALGAVHQWLSVACMVALFLTYSVDMDVLLGGPGGGSSPNLLRGAGTASEQRRD